MADMEIHRNSLTPKPVYKRWDIFCRVIDNYGDAGICWRLAQQLANEYDISVRLWIDDLTTLAILCPKLDDKQEIQHIQGIEVRFWMDPFPPISSAPVVIEAFGCRLPEIYEKAMAQRLIAPTWINLEYLSAEPWVDTVHLQASPHPLLPLVKYFFCPGFSEGSGGLLRECGLLTARRLFQQNPRLHPEFWQRIGLSPPSGETISVSLFSYDTPALVDWLNCSATGNHPVRCIVPTTENNLGASRLSSWLGVPSLQPGQRHLRGALELVTIPFLLNGDYDRLLWACDFNFVRGEDSFVRAQWAARPFCWNAYPQENDAHKNKLQAFLERYCATNPDDNSEALRRMTMLWNGFGNANELAAVWNEVIERLEPLTQNALAWSEYLSAQPDLLSRLAEFNQINNIASLA